MRSRIVNLHFRKFRVSIALNLGCKIEKMERYLIGIDEAGVGPVLGPLVVGGVKIGESKLGLLKKFGVKDSKLFGGGERAIERREKVWQKINGFAGFWVEKIAASKLDSHNWVLLEVEKIARIMTALSWWEAETIFIGWVGKLGEGRFLRLLRKNLGRKGGVNLKRLGEKIVYRKNVEEELVGGAASILAKVERDREVKKFCEKLGFGYVSGYCNTKTAEFLRKCREKYRRLPSFVRKSRKWPPLQELLL